MNDGKDNKYGESEFKIVNNHKNLIICFGGKALKFGGILPFEFLKYLSAEYTSKCDLIFFIDKKQCWYHKGIDNITHNIESTVEYIDSIIDNNKYEKIIFMGTSAGGYASILFGSLCKKVSNVISFIPQTILTDPCDKKYSNIKNFINANTKYILVGDKSITNKKDTHHIYHCDNIKDFVNVKIIRNNGCDLKKLRDSGFIKKLIDDIIVE